MTPPPRKRKGLGRPPLAVVLPVIVVVLAAAGWSAVWYEGSRRAETMIAELLAAQAAAGRSLDCAERGLGGYPFRFEVTCRSARLDIADGDRRVRASAARLGAVAMVWRLDHLIVEVEGPLRIESEGDSLDAEWDRLQASIRLSGRRLAEVAVVVEGSRMEADLARLGSGGAVAAAAERIELHQRREPGAPDMDVGLSALGLVVTPAGRAAPDPVDIAAVGRLLALPEPLPRRADAFLAAWRANGGALEIVDLRATQDETVLRAEGRLTPDARGRPEGDLTVTLAGPDVATPGAAGAFGGIAPILAAVLRNAGRSAELDGRSGVGGDLRFDGGRVYFGPMPLGELPPLL